MCVVVIIIFFVYFIIYLYAECDTGLSCIECCGVYVLDIYRCVVCLALLPALHSNDMCVCVYVRCNICRLM